MFAAPTLAAIAIAAAQPATSPQAARQIVQDYYRAIDAGDYRAAYALWADGGAASGKSFAQFASGFGDTASVFVVTYAPVDPDAGMSQRSIRVPVDVYATLKSGKQQHFRGDYTLNRVVAGVGAPQAQLSWHISGANLIEVAH